LCRFLEELGLLHHSAEAWHWTSDSYPADAVSLRALSSDNFVVVDITGEAKIIGEVAFAAALTTLHEKAIYLHEARQYQVEKLHYDGRKAYVRSIDSDYFTDAIAYTQVKELSQFESAEGKGARFVHGEVRVNRQIVGFKKIKFYTMENVGAGNLSLPEQEMHTTAFWLHFPAEFLAQFPDLSPAEKQAGLTALGNAMRPVAALLLMCDPHDLGLAVTEDITGGLRGYEPNLYLYDSYPGGVGLSAPLFRLAPKLLAATVELIARCKCVAGCPSCVGPVGEVGDRGKEIALRILTALN
jgi:DEAD/DEAH box helicase domain-containing protein